MVDHYATLGVPRTATPDEIKRAYYRRARETHPDTGGSAEAFNPVSDAWETLRDPERRATYDAALNAPPPLPPRPAYAYPHAQRWGKVHDLFDFSLFPDKTKTKKEK